MYESARCPNCHNWDALVPLKFDTRHVTWEQHGGRKVEVAQFRCVFCGAADIIRRDFSARHENDKPVTGQSAPTDGRLFVARPISPEED